MAGRGRGRGQSVSFNTDQFGLGRGDQLQTLTAPPPIFPLLENRPIPLTKGEDQEYELVAQKAIVNTLVESPFYLKPTNWKQSSEKIVMLEAHKREQELQDKLLWNRLPLELRKKVSTTKRPTSDKSSKLAKKKRVADPDKILAILAEKEKHDSDDEEDKEDNTKREESDEEEQVGDDDQDVELDEEMDEGNDYNLGYFDNGEDYLAEEENADDGEPTF